MSKSKKKKKQSASDDPNNRTVTRNRKARHEYEILEDLECGVVLQGSEVKSIRNGKVSIEEAYGRVRDGELWLVGADIAEYPQANVMNHEPKRSRKLLLHRRELRKFAESADQTGLTIVPLALYFKNGRIKVQMAVGRGRKMHDKRDKLKKQSDRREMRGAMMKHQ
ncbi:SsrA-binding protein SmpB [Thalassoroseus pseudoceratinae]|uniref:SsrA-binding protein SmpB n=1 Tax=Thalassoroseus pseudoceratinae TaxID=2713176 RepID=UPI001421CA12|nr:SsrA-binding protein SmpB [Thalassoroseus pseudoceratinae]